MKNTNGTIRLPNQFLRWTDIKKINKLVKIIFQFDIEAAANGHKTFSLVAYPVYKTKKKHKIGSRIKMGLHNATDDYRELPLPLSLGNLELGRRAIKSLKKQGGTGMNFQAFLYDKNEHAAYTVTDDSGTISLDMNPTPPGRPAE